MYGVYRRGFYPALYRLYGQGFALVPNREDDTKGYTKAMTRKARIQIAALLAVLGAGGRGVEAQSPCNNTSAYSPCEIVFELSEPEAAAHSNPYVNVDLKAEFRSPRHRTFLQPAFWDGGRRMVLRFTPTEAGDWDYRVTSNICLLYTSDAADDYSV